MKEIKQCKVEGCSNKVYSKGYCRKHYERWKTHGDALIRNNFQHDYPLEKRFWSKVDIRNPSECWPWLAGVRKSGEGYGAFWLKGRHQPASKVAYILTFGKIPMDLQVLHYCDNPRCCNPRHLFLGTNLDNVRDRVKKGRSAHGIQVNNNGLLGKSEVIAIRELLKKGRLQQKEIAKKFNVPATCINRIAKGRTYAYYY